MLDYLLAALSVVAFIGPVLAVSTGRSTQPQGVTP